MLNLFTANFGNVHIKISFAKSKPVSVQSLMVHGSSSNKLQLLFCLLFFCDWPKVRIHWRGAIVWYLWCVIGLRHKREEKSIWAVSLSTLLHLGAISFNSFTVEINCSKCLKWIFVPKDGQLFLIETNHESRISPLKCSCWYGLHSLGSPPLHCPSSFRRAQGLCWATFHVPQIQFSGSWETSATFSFSSLAGTSFREMTKERHCAPRKWHC